MPLPTPAPAPAGPAATGDGPGRAAGRCRGGGSAADTSTPSQAASAGGSRPSATSGSAAAPQSVGLGAMFLDMLRAKRDTAPDRRLLDAQLGADPGDIAAKVRRGEDFGGGIWRWEVGFGSSSIGSSSIGNLPVVERLARCRTADVFVLAGDCRARE